MSRIFTFHRSCARLFVCHPRGTEKRYVTCINRLYRKEKMGSAMSFVETPSIDKNFKLSTQIAQFMPKSPKEILAKEYLKAEKSKPPNVLVYCGRNRSDAFNRIKNILIECLDGERYTIYPFDSNLLHLSSWIDYVEVLIVTAAVDNSLLPQILKYIYDGGKLFSICHHLNQRILEDIVTKSTARDDFCRFRYVKLDESGNVQEPIPNWETIVGESNLVCEYPIMCSTNSSGTLLVSSVEDAKYVLESLSETCLPTQHGNFNETCVRALRDVFETNLSLEPMKTRPSQVNSCDVMMFSDDTHLKERLVDEITSKIRNDSLVVNGHKVQLANLSGELVKSDQPGCRIFTEMATKNFSSSNYFENLKTRQLGKLVLYADILPSTNQLAAAMNFCDGVVVIASRQTAGVGRSGNAWLSPAGCTMFSAVLRISHWSYAGQHLSFLQHIVSLAVVEAILSVPGYESLPLKLKWPNDIYLDQNIKVGGVLVGSELDDNIVRLHVGVGINLDNEKPTICVNEIIREYNRRTGNCIGALTREELTARTLTQLEALMDDFDRAGHSSILPKYYRRWLHGGKFITVSSLVYGFAEDHVVQVIGVDKYGFIRVRMEHGEVCSVSPDGNSLDLMKNMILTKS